VAESRDAYNQLDQIRREVKRLASKVEKVDANVERSRVTQLGVLATTLSEGGGQAPEIILSATGMSVPDIAAALNKNEGAVRRRINRARAKQRSSEAK
jgi:DNA-directed RNA polymerase specialized sigma24 family protein